MSLAFPWALLAGLLAVPLVLLYFLKLRRRVVVVSSTLPWRRVIEDARANAPWQRLRRNLLLLLQLLALALLVLAFAGPFVPTDAALAPDTVIVLDVSASMGAREPDGRTRLEHAHDRIARMLRALDGDRRAAIVLAGPTPQVAAPLTDDEGVLRAALATARALDAPADLAAALEMSRSLVRGGGEATGEVVLVTDAAADPTPALELALPSCRVLRVGQPADNAGLVALALRPKPGTAREHELFAAVRRRGAGLASATLVIESASSADGPFEERARTQLALGPDETRSHVAGIEAAPGQVLRVRVEHEGDALPADDQALAVVPPPDAVRLLLVSHRPYLLRQALQALPAVELSEASGIPADLSGFDLLVLDGATPEVAPPLPVLAFGAAGPAGSLLPGVRRVEAPRIVRWDRRHPALRHADLSSLVVSSAWLAQPPPAAEALVDSDQGPLAYAWPGAGGPVLAFTFDLLESDLALRVAFPILVHDAVHWLARRGQDVAVVPTGAPVRVRVGQAGPLIAEGPGFRREVVPEGGLVRLPALERAGLVTLSPAAGGSPARVVAAALLSPEETDLSPRFATDEPSPGADGMADATADGSRRPGRRWLWPPAAALAIAALAGEWLLFHRRAG